MPIAYSKTLICFANSRKTSGRCVAGKEVGPVNSIAGWVRPISDRAAGEVSEDERRFQDGKDPQLLDIISIPMRAPRPHGFQTENHLIDSGFYWTLVGRATPVQVA